MITGQKDMDVRNIIFNYSNNYTVMQKYNIFNLYMKWLYLKWFSINVKMSCTFTRKKISFDLPNPFDNNWQVNRIFLNDFKFLFFFLYKRSHTTINAEIRTTTWCWVVFVKVLMLKMITQSWSKLCSVVWGCPQNVRYQK